MATAWRWTTRSKLLLVSAMRSVRSLLDRIGIERPEWVVVVRTHAETADVFRYAYRAREIEAIASAMLPEITLEDALNLHEYTSTPVTRGRRLTGANASGNGPAAYLIDVDATGEPVAVAEALRPLVSAPIVRPESEPAPTRSGGIIIPDMASARDDGGFIIMSGQDVLGILDGPPVARRPTVESSLSAEAPTEVQVGKSERVRFRIELAEGATPLAQVVRAATLVDRPIVVALSLQNEHLRVDGPHEREVPPPAAGQPQSGEFEVHGETAGAVRAALTFRQGDSELGTLAFAIEVVDGPAVRDTDSARSAIAAPEPLDARTLVVEIEMRTDGRKRFYEFRLRNETLGLPFEVLSSQPLLDRGDKPAKALMDYVERIYERTTRELTSSGDLLDLQREMRALGARLSDELFQPDVVKRLWPLRARIGVIRLVSWEPYIPWELLRMREPTTGEIDDRFLAEYGLVRTMTGETPPRTLALRDWAWIGAQFPMQTHEDCGDTGYFTDTLPQRRAIQPVRVGPGHADFLDTLSRGEFDVLHVACHAESPQKKMDSAWLVLGDMAQPGGSNPVLIRVDTDGVKAEATKLRARRPLVFLNACESGRIGPNLTAWGGWPEVFVRAGAGAFVGTAWAVRNKPAGLFAEAFYEALLDGKMLFEAATVARAAARAAGDASWLAFKVYGHPWAVKG